ncbi:hypothetical protein [Rubellicoccus peritrichatus]|uniref:Uncharacterized protein n=1 Tax=Rubellicoccus peritrichatus TaxID=3080537 RepID=A0AAQ3L7M1_9BACT|nr:hypothetical protein [Puniceicoccus sp. CR14]WOO40566.1 hypothetical protein RZN69_18245 [Puniceicoccus sp. CR14]
MNKLRISIASLIIGAIAASTPLNAQTISSGDSVLNFLSPQTPLGISISQGIENSFGSDLKSPGTGDLSILRLDTNLTYSKSYDLSFFRAGFTYEYSDYDWSNASPFSKTNSFGLNGFGLHTFEKDRPWGVFGLASLRWGAEDNASLGEGFSFLGAVGPTYSFSKKLRIGAGLMVITQPQQATRYLPIVTLNWEINDHWSIRTFNGATVTYDLNADKETRLDFTVQYETRDFVLKTQTSPTGITDEPAVAEESVIVVFGVTQKIGGPFFVRAYLEGNLFREFELRADGNKYQTIKSDPAIGLGFQVGANF